MFDSIKLWAIGILFVLAAGGWMLDRHNQYEKGYAAAVQKQTEAIVAYQGIVVKKEQEKAEALAVLSTEHAQELAAIEANKPTEVEKTRVIVKTIVRPDTCNLTDVELRDFNEAVRAANGAGSG